MSDLALENTDPGQIRRENMAKISTAAEQIFADHGYRGASISLIANEAGVPKPNVHYYFGSKAVLYRTIVEEICTTWLAVGDGFDKKADPAKIVSGYVKDKMNLARSRPEASRLWANEMARGAPELSDYIKNTVKPWIEHKAEVLAAWAREGKITRVDPQAFFFMIWATTQHYADFESQINIVNGGKPLSDARFAEMTAEVQRMVLAALGITQ